MREGAESCQDFVPKNWEDETALIELGKVRKGADLGGKIKSSS